MCPLCCEELDETEKLFYPCVCGYQLCLFCYDRIKSECKSQCPGCRQIYGDPVTANQVIKKPREKEAKLRRPKVSVRDAKKIKITSISSYICIIEAVTFCRCCSVLCLASSSFVCISICLCYTAAPPLPLPHRS